MLSLLFYPCEMQSQDLNSLWISNSGTVCICFSFCHMVYFYLFFPLRWSLHWCVSTWLGYTPKSSMRYLQGGVKGREKGPLSADTPSQPAQEMCKPALALAKVTSLPWPAFRGVKLCRAGHRRFNCCSVFWSPLPKSKWKWWEQQLLNRRQNTALLELNVWAS